MSKEIILAKGELCIVDDEDYDYLMDINWFQGLGYARTSCNGHTFLMHRMIMRADKGQILDHINRNRLDNRKENLRFVDRTLNRYNSRTNPGRTSKFRGVHLHQGKYLARINKGYKNHQLGSYPTEFEAALAYNEAAIRLYGFKDAVLNTI